MVGHKVYVASPLGFTAATREYYERRVLQGLRGAGCVPLDPWAGPDGPNDPADHAALADWSRRAGRRNAELIDESDALLAVPLGHRLAHRARAAPRELVGEPFVTPRPGYWRRTLADRLLARAGASLTIACEGEEPAAVRGLISAGVGVGLLPAVARRVAPEPPVAWLRLQAPDCRRTLSVVWRRDRYLSAAARAFRDFAVAYFRERPGEAFA